VCREVADRRASLGWRVVFRPVHELCDAVPPCRGVGVHREVRAADPMVRRARPAGFQPGGGGGTSLDLDTAHHLSRLPRSGRRMLPCRRLRPQTRCTPSVSAASTGWSAASLTAFELYSTRPRLRTSLAHEGTSRASTGVLYIPWLTAAAGWRSVAAYRRSRTFCLGGAKKAERRSLENHV
jgi:hypothetical protein